MINFHRVFAMVIRYAYSIRHNFDRLTDMFYWPAMDLLLFGLTGLYFAKVGNIPNLLLIMVSGLVFWNVVWRTQYEITTNILAEIWDKNLVNIFASPLKVSEWIISFMIFGFIKMVVSLIFSALMAFLLYALNIFMYGFYILPFIASLLVTGWAGGFFVSGVLIRFGIRTQSLAWAGIYFIAPFSAIYYSVLILPEWAQKIAAFVPSSYIFEGIREVLFTGNLSYEKLVASFALNGVYLLLSLWFFERMFNKSRQLGLGRLI